jgi:signal transduction histidine kinase
LPNARTFPALVFVVCTLVTAFAISQMRAVEEDDAFTNFSQNSRHLTRDVESRLVDLTQLASGGAGLMNAGMFLGREGWASYIAGMPTIGYGSGFKGLGVALRVTAAAEQRFVAGVRNTHAPDFQIWHQAGAKAPADELFPVTYLVPTSSANERMLGFDLGSAPISAAAIRLARDRGEPSFSIFGNESGAADAAVGDSSVDLLLFAPFFRSGRPDSISARRETFAGVMLVAMNAERLLRPLVEAEGMRGIAVRVTDLEQEKVMFDTSPRLEYYGSRFAAQHKVTFGGRSWRLDLAATPEFVASIAHRNSILVGLLGAFGTLLLTGIVYHITELRQRAEKRALEMTAELRRSESELLRHRDHLAELVDERTAELLAAKNAAESAFLIKSEFLANMSHELRTPLHAMLSFAHLGHDNAAVQSVEKTVRYFSRIVDAGERLLELVGNLLDLSKLEAGKMVVDPQPGDLAQLLREVAAELEVLAEQRKLRWHLPPVDLQAPAMIDLLRFGQVLRNILSNAMKFSVEGGVIRVLIDEATMTLGRRTDDSATPVPAWRISIIDEGIGIPEDELEVVFDSFVQSSKTRTGAGGTGLGLAICREIVAAHRGSIVARNRAEGGAVFEILIPR